MAMLDSDSTDDAVLWEFDKEGTCSRGGKPSVVVGDVGDEGAVISALSFDSPRAWFAESLLF